MTEKKNMAARVWNTKQEWNLTFKWRKTSLHFISYKTIDVLIWRVRLCSLECIQKLQMSLEYFQRLQKKGPCRELLRGRCSNKGGWRDEGKLMTRLFNTDSNMQMPKLLRGISNRAFVTICAFLSINSFQPHFVEKMRNYFEYLNTMGKPISSICCHACKQDC